MQYIYRPWFQYPRLAVKARRWMCTLAWVHFPESRDATVPSSTLKLCIWILISIAVVFTMKSPQLGHHSALSGTNPPKRQHMNTNRAHGTTYTPNITKSRAGSNNTSLSAGSEARASKPKITVHQHPGHQATFLNM